jgi:hypothetical protein
MNQEFVKRLLKYNQDTYTISFNNNSSMCSIELEDRNILIVGKLLSGAYPNVDKIVNRPLKNRIDFNFDNLNEITKYSDKEEIIESNQNGIKYLGRDYKSIDEFILNSPLKENFSRCEKIYNI